MAKPGRDVEPFGFTEEHILPLELFDRPPQGNGPINRHRQEHGQEERSRNRVVPNDQSPKEQANPVIGTRAMNGVNSIPGMSVSMMSGRLTM